MSNPIVSICIPSYNGHVRLFKLLNSLLASPRRDFEVIIVDDCSNDETWPLLSELKTDRRFKCYRNPKNLGMDRNFAKTIEYASSDYVWLCGQDDIILTNGVDAILDTLIENPDVDFIYLNHKRVIEGFESYELDNQNLDSINFYGMGIDSFLNRSNGDLPTFLPKFLIRKSLWDAAYVKRYFGTYYCQVGVFLEVSNNIRWCHHAGNYVFGLIPSNGWQEDSSKYANIILGYFIMLFRFSNLHPSFNKKIIKEQYISHLKELFYAFLLVKKYQIKISKAIEIELLNALSNNGLSYVAKIWRSELPRFFWLCLWSLVTFKKYLNRFFHVLSSRKFWL